MINVLEFEQKFKYTLCVNSDVIVSCLNEGDVFVDVGANTGLLTQKILNTTQVKLGEIILFEPVQYLADECYKKFGKTVTLERVGLSNVNEEKLLYASKLNLAYNKIYVDGMEIHPHTKENIKCVRFSDWVGNRKIDFVKIDVEGHDIEVIEGMYEWLDRSKQRPYILFEGNWRPNDEAMLAHMMLEKYGYTNKIIGRDILLTPKNKRTDRGII